jgi:hypothetical protein
MDAPIASLIAKSFCDGYVKQAKKEEKEAEDIVNRIDYDALKALCIRYDNKMGKYPENEYEGRAVLAFFDSLRSYEMEEVEEKKIDEIKFRAWDRLNKEMYPNPFNGRIGELNDTFAHPGNWTYLQYTGLNDMNGVEIYEGDIFQDSDFRSVVLRHLGAFGYIAYGDFIAFASNYHFKWANGKSNKILVIGNIYENPRLAACFKLSGGKEV